MPLPLDMYQIRGARPLQGIVNISGSKNATLPLMTATLLSDEPSYIENVPNLRDVRAMIKLLQHLGAKVTFSGGTLKIDPRAFNVDTVHYDLMVRMRASFYAMGPMLARLGKAHISMPGGCAIGDRPVDIHLRGFEELGVRHHHRNGYIHAMHNSLVGTRLSLMGPNGTSVGATCNVMMAAVLAKGTTIIDDAAREPEILELANFLNSMGARISGQGTGILKIEGVKKLFGTNWKVCPDRIEAATFAVAALATHGDVTLRGVQRTACASTLFALEQWGAAMDWPEPDVLHITRGKKEKRPLHIVTEPFPGFPTDAQSQLTALLALTPGTSHIRETIYPERFKHVPELNRLGANIRAAEKGKIEISGVPALEGAAVMASDLRAGAALIVAALAAHGTSQVRRIYHVDRGYEMMEEKLRTLGAVIERQKETAEDPGMESLSLSAEEEDVTLGGEAAEG